MAVETESQAKRNRTRSPSYPYLDLPAALEKAAALWNVEGRHPAPVAVVMQHWGYKEESSTGYSCVAALKKFGLVDHDGMGETRQIRLSALALAILLDRDPDSADRRDAVRRAALNPRIHAELWERYGADLPSDQTLRRFLVGERHFNEASVDELLAGYKETVVFAGLAGRLPAAPAVNGHDQTHVAGVNLPAIVDAIPAADAPRGVQPARERAGDGAVGSWQGRGRAAAPPAQASVMKDIDDQPVDPDRARRELPVPLDNGLVARVPYPMSEEDFSLLLDTLQLWKSVSCGLDRFCRASAPLAG